MSNIIWRYVTPFLTPLQQLQLNPTRETHKRLTKELEKYIDSFGFSGAKVIEIVNSERDTYIAGSFILDFLTQKYEHKWKAHDIDIFTSSAIFGTKDYVNNFFKDDSDIFPPGYKRHHTGEEKMYTSHFKVNIIDFKELTNVKTNKDIQFIIVKNAKDTISNNFDLDIVKARFNGKKFKIDEQTLYAIKTKTSFVKSIYGEAYMFNRALRRAKKYASRGYKIYLPTRVLLLSNKKSADHWTKLPDKIYEPCKSSKHLQSTNYIHFEGNAPRGDLKIQIDLSFYTRKIKDSSKAEYLTYETAFEPPSMSLK